MRKSYTKRQLELQKILEELGFQTELEVLFYPYRIDILIKEVWIAVEYDGPLHISKSVDEKRNQYLWDNFELPTLRIKEKDFANKEELRRKILQFIEEKGISKATSKFFQ